MKLKDILQYELISTSDFQMTVYDLLISLLTIFITIFVLRLIKSFFKRLEHLNKMEHGVAASIYKILQYIVWVIIITIVLQTFGIDITVLVAGSAALFVGIGLGLQNLFNDIASGFIILFERPLKVTDVVELDDGTVGRVINIGLRVSEIRDRNNITIIVPNSQLVNEKVINWSHIERNTRFRIKVGVAYGSDVDLVKQLLTEAVKAAPEVEQTPAPFARFSEFGHSALDFELFFWTKESFIVENIKSDIRMEINRLFKDHGITIAFPQLDVHIRK